MSESQLKYFLFARPTFFAGAATLLDFGNTLFAYNDSPTGEVADYFAIKNDWILVGEDMQDAVDSYASPEQQLELIPSSVG